MRSGCCWRPRSRSSDVDVDAGARHDAPGAAQVGPEKFAELELAGQRTRKAHPDVVNPLSQKEITRLFTRVLGRERCADSLLNARRATTNFKDTTGLVYVGSGDPDVVVAAPPSR
jgi:hypothetical protein